MLTLHELTVLGAVVKLGWKPKRSEVAKEVSDLMWLAAGGVPLDERASHVVMDQLLAKGLLMRADGRVTLTEVGVNAYNKGREAVRSLLAVLP